MTRQHQIRWLLASALGAAVLLGSAESLNAQSASFDCTKATAPDELAICANPELAGLDRLVAAGYQDLQRRLGTRNGKSDPSAVPPRPARL